MSRENEPALDLCARGAACDGVTDDGPLLVRLLGEAARRRQRIGRAWDDDAAVPHLDGISEDKIA